MSAEEVFELRFPHPDWVPMQTRQAGLEGTGGIRLRDLVKESLRMRPSRLIVGEVRAEECLDLLLALNSGLPGMCTLHANSAREALVKMCTLPLLAGENIGARFVVPTVAASVDLVVHLGLDPQGVRRANEIVAVPGRVENDVIETETIFERRGSELRHTGGMPARLDRFERVGIDLPAPARGRRLMGAVVGLGVGIGLMLIWSAFVLPRRTRQAERRQGRVAMLLARAGLGQVSVNGFAVLCLALGSVTALLLQLVSRTPPVAVVFGAIGAYLPVAIVTARARRRQREFAVVWPEAVDSLASGVRAGLSLSDALSALGTRGPEPLREPFAAFALDYQASGRFGRASIGSRTASPTRSATESSKDCG